MSIGKRWLIFLLGTMCQSLGIALVVKSTLGTSPISSVPYVMSLTVPLTFGQTTFIINMLFIVLQIVLLRRNFDKMQLLQIPATFIFASLIDVAMSIFSSLAPEFYPFKFLVLAIGAMFVSLGVALQVIANVLMLTGEALVTAISRVTKIEFGNVKTAFDCVLVLIAAVWSYAGLGTIEGIREGTLISALVTGTIARFLIGHLSRTDSHGKRTIYLHV